MIFLGDSEDKAEENNELGESIDSEDEKDKYDFIYEYYGLPIIVVGIIIVLLFL